MPGAKQRKNKDLLLNVIQSSKTKTEKSPALLGVEQGNS
jgi:hypothetical protein